jgi:hypothetical protein
MSSSEGDMPMLRALRARGSCKKGGVKLSFSVHDAVSELTVECFLAYLASHIHAIASVEF